MTGGTYWRGSEGVPLGGRPRRAMLRSNQAPRVGGAHTRDTAKPLTKIMRAAPDIDHNPTTALGRQVAACRARSDREAPMTGDRSSVDNFA